MASEALEMHPAGVVKGQTSKGIFLQSRDYILFITDTPYKSPFNILIPGVARLMEVVAVGDVFDLTNGTLVFAKNKIQIIIENAVVWEPEPPHQLVTDLSVRNTVMDSLLTGISALDPGKGWIFLFNHNLALPEDLANQISNNTQKFSKGFQDQNMETCLEAASHLLGLGGGLTPSGDDWLAGFLLYQTRMQQTFAKQVPFLLKLGDKLLDLAYQKTTTISANRLSAAQRGWAEEPFLQVIDALFTGAKIPEELVALLTNFGHSSGVDTTLGIAAAIECE